MGKVVDMFPPAPNAEVLPKDTDKMIFCVGVREDGKTYAGLMVAWDRLKGPIDLEPALGVVERLKAHLIEKMNEAPCGCDSCGGEKGN